MVPATQTIYELYANVTGRGLLDKEEMDGDGIEYESIDKTNKIEKDERRIVDDYVNKVVTYRSLGL